MKTGLTLVCHLTFKKQIKTLLVIENNKVIGLITARSGSKEFPIRTLGISKEKSLIEWAGLLAQIKAYRPFIYFN